MAEQYLSAFNGAWSAPSNYNANPEVRAQNAINTAAPAFINGIKQAGQLSSEQASMMLGHRLVDQFEYVYLPPAGLCHQ